MQQQVSITLQLGPRQGRSLPLGKRALGGCAEREEKKAQAPRAILPTEPRPFTTRVLMPYRASKVALLPLQFALPLRASASDLFSADVEQLTGRAR